MAPRHFFDAATDSGTYAELCSAQGNGTYGQVNILDRDGAAVISNASADNLIYSALAAGGDDANHGLTRRATAYQGATGATAAFAASRNALGLVRLTASGLVLTDITGFCVAVIRAAGYEDRDAARRFQAVNEARVW